MKPYRPSNGSEGEWFMGRYCENCHFDQKYQRTQDGKHGCKIIVYSFAYDIGHPKYPKEWVEDENGPRCTKYEMPRKRERRAVKKHRKIAGQGDLI